MGFIIHTNYIICDVCNPSPGYVKLFISWANCSIDPRRDPNHRGRRIIIVRLIVLLIVVLIILFLLIIIIEPELVNIEENLFIVQKNQIKNLDTIL